ncbi:MAG TPA: hypothetical protein VEI97_01005 [bacterium]|nr:hypothetical protein [bacterium]
MTLRYGQTAPDTGDGPSWAALYSMRLHRYAILFIGLLVGCAGGGKPAPNAGKARAAQSAVLLEWVTTAVEPLVPAPAPLAAAALSMPYDPTDPKSKAGLLEPRGAVAYHQLAVNSRSWVNMPLWTGKRFPVAYPAVLAPAEGPATVTAWSEDEIQAVVFNEAGVPVEHRAVIWPDALGALGPLDVGLYHPDLGLVVLKQQPPGGDALKIWWHTGQMPVEYPVPGSKPPLAPPAILAWRPGEIVFQSAGLTVACSRDGGPQVLYRGAFPVFAAVSPGPSTGRAFFLIGASSFNEAPYSLATPPQYGSGATYTLVTGIPSGDEAEPEWEPLLEEQPLLIWQTGIPYAGPQDLLSYDPAGSRFLRRRFAGDPPSVAATVELSDRAGPRASRVDWTALPSDWTAINRQSQPRTATNGPFREATLFDEKGTEQIRLSVQRSYWLHVLWHGTAAEIAQEKAHLEESLRARDTQRDPHAPAPGRPE